MPKEPLDFDDPKVEERWCNQQREAVRRYLDGEGVKYNDIGDWPAWHVPPLIAIWAIESRAKPGWIGWWVISGDLPTDYVSASDIKPPQHPRKALQAIVTRWTQLVSTWKSGKQHPDMTVPKAKSLEQLAPLLAQRVKLFEKWLKDDSLWPVE